MPKKCVPLFIDLLIDSFGKFLFTELVLINKISPSDFSDTNNESARPITGGVSKIIKSYLLLSLISFIKVLIFCEFKSLTGSGGLVPALRTSQFLKPETDCVTSESFNSGFVSILDNINGAPGLSFLYSQFRSVEGIEIFSRVLNSNGYGRYSDDDSVIELFDMVEVILEKSKKKFHTGMVVDMKYLNEDKPYYKKLGKKMIEMEVEDRLDELVIQELQKCKKIYDTKGVIGVLKKIHDKVSKYK